MIKIFPSLISADLLNLKDVINQLDPHCAGYHLDIMDFHFVPNLTWGPVFINAIRKATQKQLHIHLMVDNPEKYLDRCQLNQGDIISVHPESPSKLSFPELLKTIKSRGYIPSIALNPATPLEAAITVQAPLEHVLLMSVQPGFSGQKFMSHILDKLKALSQFRASHKLNFTICMDGGINSENLQTLIQNGVDQVAVASAIFSQSDPVAALKQLATISV